MKTVFPLRYRLQVLIASAIILLASLIPLLQLHINSDLESYMPPSMQSKQNNLHISEHFTNSENLLLIVEAPDILATGTLHRLETLSLELQNVPMVTRVHSLFQTSRIHTEDGYMQVDPVITYIPQTIEEREKLRRELLANDLAAGLVVSGDFRHAMILLDLQRDTSNVNADAELIHQIRQIIESVAGPELILLTGQPYLRYEANQQITRDMLVLLPLGLLIMLLFLWWSFRELKAVLLPFSVVIFSILFSMALLPAFGWELSLIGILIPIMMIAIANNYGVHVVARYQEINTYYPGIAHNQAIDMTVRYLSRPVWLCGLTTIAGTLGLTAHLLTPARQMGVVAALGIGFALLMSMTYLPALMSYLQPSSKKANKGKFLQTTLEKAALLSIHHPRSIIGTALVLLIVGITGMLQLSVAPDSNKILPYNHEFNQAIRIADKQFGGSKMLQVMIEGDARDPQLLRSIDAVATSLNEHQLTGHSASLATMIKKMHYSTEPSLPDSREAIAQYLELYGMSADVADYERFINFNYTHTLLTVQYRSGTLKEVNQLLSTINSELKQHQLQYLIGGVSLVDKEISESVRIGQINSLVVALIAIFILLSILFRSLKAGLLGSIPLVFAVVCTFGFMGWVGIELDIVTALLSSVSIGLGVDFTIHIFWRMKSELRQSAQEKTADLLLETKLLTHKGSENEPAICTTSQPDWSSAIYNTLTGTGRGITINAFSVMAGFSVLLISSFPFVRAFGILIILSLLLCLLSALLLVTALIRIFKIKL